LCISVIRRGREKDAVTFTELHRKLQTQVLYTTIACLHLKLLTVISECFLNEFLLN